MGKKTFNSKKHFIYQLTVIKIYGGILTKGNDVLNELYQLDLDNYHWSLPFSAGINPGSRYNHASVFIKNKEKNDKSTIMILGGLGGIK